MSKPKIGKVGKAVADTLGLDLTVKDDRKASIKLLIQGWIKAGEHHPRRESVVVPRKRREDNWISLI